MVGVEEARLIAVRDVPKAKRLREALEDLVRGWARSA
jgi:hypothetical protein